MSLYNDIRSTFMSVFFLSINVTLKWYALFLLSAAVAMDVLLIKLECCFWHMQFLFEGFLAECISNFLPSKSRLNDGEQY